jgi:HAD superfamily hydrolase (TIGR01509 family)
LSTGWIFDFDGVLVNTMEGHFACYGQALAEAGVPIDRAQFYSQAGMTGREQIRYFAEKAGKSVDPDAVYQRKSEIFREKNPEAKKIECMVELLHTLRAAGHRIAIATGSSRPSVLPVIARYDLAPDALVTSEDVLRGKPHPDLFLLAAERLGLPPAQCVVIEDSDVGIEAAGRGGMRALRFYDLAAGRAM